MNLSDSRLRVKLAALRRIVLTGNRRKEHKEIYLFRLQGNLISVLRTRLGAS
jgi:hypothetical protein